MATTKFYGLLLFLFVLLGPVIGKDYRLPTVVSPTSYTVNLTPAFTDKAEEDVKVSSFSGDVEITAVVDKEGTEIVLHCSKDMVFEEIKITPQDGEENIIPFNETNYDEDTQQLTIPFPLTEDMVDKTIKIAIEYEGKLQTDMYGFYVSTYDVGEKTKVLLATQFESTSARKAFPSFDEPHFKSTFKISITVPDRYLVLSNSPRKPESDADSRKARAGPTKFEFEETAIMPTYLVAFLVYDRETYDSSQKVISKSEVVLTSWAQKSAIDQHLTDYSQEVTHRILEELDSFTGIPYKKRMDKIDQAAIPDFSAGAMENWGLVTYREDNLFFSDVNSTESDRRGIAMVIAHELTHQWFGNLVTTDWWSSTWLNEGFARYFQYYIMSLIHPSWRMMEQFVVNQQQSVFATDALESAKPITVDVNTPEEISGQFSSAAYSKGGCVVRLMNQMLGEENFQEGIRQYLKNRQDKTATPDQLFDAIEEVVTAGDVGLTGKTLKEVFKSWTELPGYPVIEVTASSSDLKLQQKRFFLDETSSDKTLYGVNIIAAFEDKHDEKFWLVEEQRTFKTEGKPFLMIKNTGYFRVKYENDHWAKLAEILHENQKTIAPLERATLVDDALNLARAGKLEYEVAFSLLSYLENEIDYIPWAAASTAFDFLYSMMGEEEDFQEFMKTILGNVYQELGFKDHGDHVMKLHRTAVLRWACRVDIEGCRDSAIKLLTKYFNEGELVPANLRSTVYCYGVKGKGKGPETLWNNLWYLFKENEDVSERALLISALGCTDSKSTLYMYLEETLLDRYIRFQDVAKVYSAVYSNRDSGVDVSIDFFVKNFDRIKKVYTTMNAMRNVVQGIANQITTEAQATKFLTFLEDNKNDDAIKEVVASAQSSIKTNREWIEKKKDIVIDAIKKVNA